MSVTCYNLYVSDLNLQPRSSACWTAQLLSAFQGLRGCELYVRAVQTGHAIIMQEFTADLKHRMRGVWRDAELVDHITHNNKLATYHSWFAIPFSRNERMPINVPRNLGYSLPLLHCFLPHYCSRQSRWLPQISARCQKGVRVTQLYPPARAVEL